MFLVDTNILLDIITKDPNWHQWSGRTLNELLRIGQIGINQIVYTETSLAFENIETLARTLDTLMLERLQIPDHAAFRAGRAFLEYRRAGGVRTAPMPDFYIGAHTETADLAILTRDVRHYRTYFASVRLISPWESDPIGQHVRKALIHQDLPATLTD